MIDDDDDDSGAITGVNKWQRKPKYSEDKCPQFRSVHQRSHMT
jgi:hypothetical protein